MSGIIYTCLLLAGSLFTSCKGGAADAAGGKGVHLKGTLSGCQADSVYVFMQTGVEYQRLGAGKLTLNGAEATVDFHVQVPAEGLYFLGTAPQAAARVVLGNENDLQFSASCVNIPGTLQFSNSALNKDYRDLMQGANNQMNAVRTAMNNMQMAMQMNPGQVQQFQTELNNAHATRMQFLESYIAKGGVIGKIATLIYLKPFGMDPSHIQKYPTEIHYIAATFFDGIDLSDPAYAYIPNIMDRASEYAMTMTSQPALSNDSIRACMLRVYNATPENSAVRKMIITGYLQGLANAKSDLYPVFGEIFLKAYPEKTAFSGQVERSVTAMKKFAPGAVPPDINLSTPQGSTLALSSLKGQVVMIDFWASWCRPCRMENPNVVRMYNKYHDKGFEVLGVSLDKDKDPWLQAIAADGLIWKHVSDLAGWASVAARDYEVTSIPMTFLLDREGKIIGKNLRGPALESKLREIFGF